MTNSSLGQIRVSGEEITGAVEVRDGTGAVVLAQFDATGRATAQRTTCTS